MGLLLSGYGSVFSLMFANGLVGLQSTNVQLKTKR
jgi:hypothetical protein